MRRSVCLPLALLFLASVLPSYAQIDVSTTEAAAGAAAGAAAAAAGGGVSVVEGNELLYDVRGLLTINCSDLVVPGVKLVWKINGTLLSELPDAARARVLVSEAGVLSVARTTEDDFGNYSCAGGERAPREFAVRGRPHARMPENANVVEGHKLKLTCRLGGKPYVAVEWLYAANETEAGGAGAAPLAGRGERRPNEQGVEGAQLVLDDARAADAGYYHCRPAHPAGVAARTHLRVKDKYAALWPFLGICAEVFVLCAIILVYEKRRTKPELDDSDTDNHDQKKS